MDVFDLDRVAFMWDEWMIPGYNAGGINTRVLTTNSDVPPFIGSSGTTLHIDGTDIWGEQPDVAFGLSGDKVRVAYINWDTVTTGMSKTIYVRSKDFMDVLSGSSSINFDYEDSILNATTLWGALDGDHISLDCPDHEVNDLWSLAYNADDYTIMARTQGPSGSPVSTMLNVGSPGLSSNPTTAYTFSASEINYGWYSADPAVNGFISNQLSNDGLTFVAPTFPGIYKVVQYFGPPPAVPTTQGRTINFNRQNDRNSVFFMAYSLPGLLGPGSWLDMRSKIVSWTATSFRPGDETTGITDNLTRNKVGIHPNPFSDNFFIWVKGHDSNELFEATINDMLGRLSIIKRGTVSEINDELASFGSQVSSGVYFLKFRSIKGTLQETFKLVKK